MAARRYWLMKTEPDAFSIDDLARVGREPWNGVRNYQARNYMRDHMRAGDGVLIYHSNCKLPGVAGIARVAGDSYPDPSQFDARSDYHDPKATPEEPRWFLVDVEYERHLARVVGLDELKSLAALEDSPLVRRGNRLSVLPLAAAHWRAIVAQENKQP
ncbi:MAG: EVE domain-containing protein [Xanthomonadales bacterium]|nr:EVE domain-containing protein [Xanthomonadales bacterium]